MGVPLVYYPLYSSPFPEGHRFPMPKFKMIYEILVEDGIAEAGSVHTPTPASRELLSGVHTFDYIDAFFDGSLDRKALRRIGLPWSAALVERTRAAVSGTLLAARLALDHGIACNMAGGTHHAHPDFGSGFCIFNDLAVAAKRLIDDGSVDRILIVDLDVHQGDGTAGAMADTSPVFTFSMHSEKNFPFRKLSSDLDVGLDDGLEDEAYLHTLSQYLPGLLEELKPDLVLYDAGVDPHVDDRLGRLQLSDEGLARRDRYVLENSLSRGIPVAGVIGGGYSADHRNLARRHTTIHREADRAYRKRI
ncbi:MAG: histone deacetylase family protein [Spirochaetota bacterium]